MRPAEVPLRSPASPGASWVGAALGALIAGCSAAQPPDDRALHGQALALLEQADPSAAAICAQIEAPALRSDCAWAAAEILQDPALCEPLPDGDECFFVLAEASGDVTHCDRAGRFEQDCRLHHFSRGLSEWLPRDAAPGWFEPLAAQHIQRAGLAPEDMAPWSAVYRRALSGRGPLDRAACDAVSVEPRREACRQTAVAVFHDRLNRARDRGAPRSLCEGPLPAAAAYLPDPALDAALAERRAADLCDPGAVRAPPPPGALPGE